MYVDILILGHLQDHPQHGYEIKKNVERVVGQGITINNNLLYPALKRFEEMGAVEREVERQRGRPDRHIYRLTDRGEEILQELLREFPPELAKDQDEFMVRVAWFHLLEPEARREILAAREAVVRRSLEHLELMRRLAQEAGYGGYPGHPYGERVIAFHERANRLELAWIDELRQEITEGEQREERS